MIVCDASFLIHFLMGEENSKVVETIAGAGALAAPALVDFEVLQGIRRGVLSRKASNERAGRAVADFYDLPIERFPLEPFAERVWALRSNATIYDASYIALAEDLESPLYTLDRRLANVPGHRAAICLWPNTKPGKAPIAGPTA